MKVILSFFLLIYWGLNNCDGQAREKIPIPVLKENKAIDSLLDIISDPKTQPNSYDDAKPLQDSCIILSIVKAKDSSFLFYLSTQTKRNINYSLNFLDQNHAAFGYFEYKGIKVFVREWDHFYIFFAGTSNFKSLKFTYKLKDDDHELPDSLIPRGARAWDFKYKGGHFSQLFLHVGR